MTFLSWLTANAYRDDGVGEIAKKVVEDKSYPVYMFDIYSVHEQALTRRGGSDRDHRLLRRSWREYASRYQE
jgi:hypothetical protein